MRLLLDTHVLLWALTKSDRLSPRAVRLIEDRRNQIWVSVASIWELSIKYALKKIEIDLPGLESVLEKSDFALLPVMFRHAVQVSELPHYHGDPFDRMLIAQAIAETAHLLTNDSQLSKYGQTVMLI